MYNETKFNQVLAEYKKVFPTPDWKVEVYKWEAVQHFQKHWDIESTDFYEMVKDSFSKTGNLLTSYNRFPIGVLLGFVEAAESNVKEMFSVLYDESLPLENRIDNFLDKSEELYEKFGEPGKNHYQDMNAISTYLWLKYPDKYYIYKYSECLKLSEILESSFKPKRNGKVENVIEGYKLYDEISSALKEDEELQEMVKTFLSDKSYPDPESKTLAIDFGYFTSREYKNNRPKIKDSSLEGWFPKDYSPNISTDEWLELLSNDAVFNNQALRIMKRMLDIGGVATCKQLSEKYGGHINLYNVGSSSLAMRVAKETKCPVMESDTENSKWWPILYLGRYTKNKDEGIYKWRLRPELKLALEQFDLSNINLYELKTSESSSYSKTDFLDEVYMEEDKYNELVKLLDIKKNIILQGAPGVGKTFMAKRLAYSILGEKDDDKIEVVQFHQNYSYEDFVMGYKPIDDGFRLEDGIFYKFCKKANENPGSKYFFIIDEINRGNLSKIFGELLMLIESDKRGEELTLAYSKETFSVPENLYIIGMMNTADRSLAMIDYALRRRFSFFEMEPAFRSTGFKAYQNKLNHDRFDRLIKKVEDLNNAIEEDSSLGRGFCIGHSYFCGRSFSDDEWIRLVINYDVLPMLKEYYFDDESSYEKWERELLGILDE